MATIAQDIAQIRNATYGKEVRAAIADGIENCYADVNSAKTLADDSVANQSNVLANTNLLIEDKTRAAIDAIDKRKADATKEITDATRYANDAAYSANSAADNARAASAYISGVFDSNVAYHIGDYVVYNGSLYRFTKEHSPGEWIESDVIWVVFSDEIADLRSSVEQEKIRVDSAIDSASNILIQKIASEESRAARGEAQLLQEINNEYARALSRENAKLDKPSEDPTGNPGQYLKTLGNGETVWANLDDPDESIIAEKVGNWLNAHPEATTSVADGSIGESKLDTSLLRAYRRAGNAMVYFPSLEEGGYSSSTALMTVGDKTVLFDASAANCRSAIMTYYTQLYNDGLFANIDYVVISHYHNDHCDNLKEILEAFPHNGCHAYIPMSMEGYYPETTYTDSLLHRRSNVINILNEAQVEYTEVNAVTVVTVIPDFCTIELLNSTVESYSHYRDTLTFDVNLTTQLSNMYNNYSMVSLVKIGSVYCMFPGDIERAAQDYIYSTRTLPRLFLYAVHHHGIQNDDNIYYMDAINPEYGVIQTNYARGLESAASSMSANYAVNHLGSTGYSSYEFTIGKNGGFILHGREIQRSGWYYSYIDMYVDSEYTGTVHDGTKEHPFSRIGEAMLFYKERSNVHYRIRLVARDTPYQLLWLRDLNIAVDFYAVKSDTRDKPLVKGLYVRNCKQLGFSNIIFNGYRNTHDINAIIYAENSELSFISCEFDGLETSSDRSSYTVYALESNMSCVYISDSRVGNCRGLNRAYRHCDLVADSISFHNVFFCYTQRYSKIRIRGLDKIEANGATYYIIGSNSGYPVELSGAGSLSELNALFEYNDSYASSVITRSTDMVPFKIAGKKAVVTYDTKPFYCGEISDANEALTSGTYYYPSSALNIPAAAGGMLLVLSTGVEGHMYCTQIAHTNSYALNGVFIRKGHPTNGWSEWSYLVGNGSSYSLPLSSIVEDLDDATTLGFYTFANSAKNRPTDISTSGGTCLVLNYGKYVTQIASMNTSNLMKLGMRKYNGTTWTKWMEIQFSSPA